VVPDIIYPSAIDPSEWGESQAEEALPWDTIRPIKYSTSADIQTKLKSLQAKHNERIKNEDEFNYLESDIVEYNENKDKKYVSLNEAERLKEKEQKRIDNLARLNERLTRFGFEKVDSLDADLPEKIEEMDPFLEETARIVQDLIATGAYAKVVK
jgi:carboxyl-terminal processing protease